MIYSDMQLLAIQDGSKVWHERGKVFRIGGYAGTGKTTVAKAVCGDRYIAYCSFMGKAANVMRRKGMTGASTIHKLIYEWDDDAEIFRQRMDLGSIQGICVDEGSTICIQLWTDLLSYHLPILVLGDPGQLEPVGEDAKLMSTPDIILDRVFRNEGSIADYCARIRGGMEPLIGDYGDVKVKEKSTFVWTPGTRIICGFNKTRVAFNRLARKELGFTADICVGDEMICLHNGEGMFNGQMFTIKRILGEGKWNCTCMILLDDGSLVEKKLWKGHLGKSTKIDWRKYPRRQVICDYANAVTCHKMIGSEEDRVVVWDEQCDLWNPIRWRYTALTRASLGVTCYV